MDQKIDSDDYWRKSMTISSISAKSAFVVAVDGPAASGKSSLCRRACALEGWVHVSTGILYRGLGALCQQNKLPIADSPAMQNQIDDFIANIDWQFRYGRLLYRGRDISGDLNSVPVSKAASQVAELKLVREAFKPLQRDLIKGENGVFLIDGRDIGTVIFPDAGLKIFLTANLDVRTARRLTQLRELQLDAQQDAAAIRKNLEDRDYYDINRTYAPLKKADDSVEIDTSELDFDQSIQLLIATVKSSAWKNKING